MRVNMSMRTDHAWPPWAGVPSPVAEGPSSYPVLALYENAKNVTIFLNPYLCCEQCFFSWSPVSFAFRWIFILLYAPPLTPLFEMYQARFDLWELLQKGHLIIKKCELEVFKNYDYVIHKRSMINWAKVCGMKKFCSKVWCRDIFVLLVLRHRCRAGYVFIPQLSVGGFLPHLAIPRFSYSARWLLTTYYGDYY